VVTEEFLDALELQISHGECLKKSLISDAPDRQRCLIPGCRGTGSAGPPAAPP
jgi:hypothetical protein